MKQMKMALGLALAFGAGAMLSAQMRDWHDLDAVHSHVIQAIHEMEQARQANHYDMEGHGAKAEEALHTAEHELDMAVRSARRR